MTTHHTTQIAPFMHFFFLSERYNTRTIRDSSTSFGHEVSQAPEPHHSCNVGVATPIFFMSEILAGSKNGDPCQ